MSPGCSIQSLAASAREAWIKLYKATPASRDSQISYYRLGAAVAFCLDVRLRSGPLHGGNPAGVVAGSRPSGPWLQP